jgi:hypothetical protein
VPIHEHGHILEHGDIITTGERWGTVWSPVQYSDKMVEPHTYVQPYISKM